MLASLQARMEMGNRSSPRELTDKIEELETVQAGLTKYSRLLNTDVGQSGRTLHDVYWAAIRSGSDIEDSEFQAALRAVDYPGALAKTRVAFDRTRDKALTIQDIVHQIDAEHGGLEAHPWRGLGRESLSPFEGEEIVGLFKKWKAAVDGLLSQQDRWHESLSMPVTTDPRRLSACAKGLETIDNLWETVDWPLASRIAGSGTTESVAQFLSRLDEVQSLQVQIRSCMKSPDSPIPDPEEIRLYVAAISRIAQRLSRPDPASIGDIPAWTSAAIKRAQTLEAVAKEIDELVRLTGLDLEPSQLVLEELEGARSLVLAASVGMLRVRTPRICSAASSDVVASAHRRWQELSATRDSISTLLATDAGQQVALLRSSARVLRETGVWGRIFGRDFKRARAEWERLSVGGRKTHPKTMADELDQLADWESEVETFETDSEIHEVCGSMFHGLATDFGVLLEANRFAQEVRSKFSSSSDSGRAIRSWLLEADADSIQKLSREGASIAVERLERLMPELTDPEPDSRTNLRKLASDAAQEQAELEQSSGGLGGQGLRDDLTLPQASALAAQIAKAEATRRKLDADEEASSALGSSFGGSETDRRALGTVLSALEQLAKAELAPEYQAWLLKAPQACVREELQTATRRLKANLDSLHSTAQDAVAVARLDPDTFLGRENRQDLRSISQRISEALNSRNQMASWTNFQQYRGELSSAGLSGFLEVYETKMGGEYSEFADCMTYVYFTSLLRGFYEQNPELKRFSGTTQEEARRRFSELDKEVSLLKRKSIAAALLRSTVERGNRVGPKRSWSDASLVEHEVGKRKRHIPLRNLLKRASTAIQQMKPCWMMSPASVAQFLEPGSVAFDMVIIDEASQMKPEDSMGALARTGQAIVVGDPQQLPPTSFFDRIEEVDEDDEFLEDLVDNESILDMSLASLRCSRELRWHYRSRHESLIAFSNRNFYDSKLVVFPSPVTSREVLGVEYRFVEGAYVPKARFNMPEAEAMVETALQLMTENPEKSLGLVTMNQSQRDTVSELLDATMMNDRAAQEYDERWSDTLEPPFVKNLENVQGDERDIIVIGTVYGPNVETGKIAQRFGPINSATGHRRLNVLFTRAKERVIVFSSMRPTDILANPTGTQGVRVLRDYLAYAQDGRREAQGVPGMGEPESDFEMFVGDALQSRGHSIEYQVGVDGYRIDIAVRHPDDPGVYLLGVECDGARYHSSKFARDRDRLRQEILEKLGWNIYRIWSVDWFENPERETKKLCSRIEELAVGL